MCVCVYVCVSDTILGLTEAHLTHLLPLALLLMLCTRSNTDSNKFVIFSGIILCIII